MKKKATFAFLLAGAVVFTACKQKSTEEPSAAQTGTSQPEQPATPDEPTAPVKPVDVTKQRADKLGFAKHLPKDIVMYDAVFNGKKALDDFIKTPLGVFLMERMEDEGISLDDLQDNDEIAGLVAMYSEEFFTAYGPGTGDSLGLASRFLERLGYYGARFITYGADAHIRSDGTWSGPRGNELLSGPLKGGPRELVKMIAEFEMPAYYQGVKVSNPETRGYVLEELGEVVTVLQMLPEGVEEISVKRGGAEFNGYKVVGADLAKLITDDAVTELQEVFDLADIEAFKKALAGKNLVALTGEIGDYAILFYGESEEDLKIVDDINESICASEHMAFVDEYLANELLLVGMRDKSVYASYGDVGATIYRILSSFSDGLNDGFSNAGSLGDTQEIEVLLESLSKQGLALAEMVKGADAGYVAYLEDGLKFESYGGSNMPAINFGATHTLDSMAAGDNTLLFANWTSNADYNEKVMEYVDTLGETGYLVAQRFAALDLKGGDMKQFQQGFGMFDQMFKDDVLGVWKALRGDMAAGLGPESALVVDVNGALPKIPLPDIPEGLLKEGKMPRMAYVSTVDDREKLKQSWQRLNKSIENMLKKISEFSGGEIPMQVPMSSEKNELTTWFVPIPFQNDDFVPSVSVSDSLFFVSTSKQFSEGLAARAKQGGGGDRKGAWVHVDFKVMNQFAKDWLGLVEKHIDELAAPESAQRRDFDANKEMLQEALKSLGTLDELSVHTRREDGRTRVSMHIKTK